MEYLDILLHALYKNSEKLELENESFTFINEIKPTV
jgi:hypothetical protein